MCLGGAENPCRADLDESQSPQTNRPQASLRAQPLDLAFVACVAQVIWRGTNAGPFARKDSVPGSVAYSTMASRSGRLTPAGSAALARLMICMRSKSPRACARNSKDRSIYASLSVRSVLYYETIRKPLQPPLHWLVADYLWISSTSCPSGSLTRAPLENPALSFGMETTPDETKCTCASRNFLAIRSTSSVVIIVCQ